VTGVAFPDNSTILAANITTDAHILLDLDNRVKDVSVVLNNLSKPSTTKRLTPSLACGLDVQDWNYSVVAARSYCRYSNALRFLLYWRNQPGRLSLG